MIVSPCIDVCVLDSRTQLCRGCQRTVEEIAAWPQMTDADKVALKAVLFERARQQKAAQIG